MQSMNRPTDVVIYWVDGSDPAWLAEYSKFKNSAPKRFRDLGILKYVFRSIEINMPWIRYVHFITNGQLPDWLDVSCPKLKFHTHCDIFAFKDALPVFNSSAIEANFSQIPDLADKFVLFNDDMLVMGQVAEERFFRQNLPVDYIKLSFPRRGRIYEKLKPQNVLASKFINNAYKYLNDLDIKNIAKNKLYSPRYTIKTKLNNLIWSLFGKVQWFDIYHHPQPHLKKTWCDFFDKHKDDVIKDTSYAKFRSEKDINQYVYRFINLINGDFYPAEFKDHRSIYVGDVKEFIEQYSRLADGLNFLCICEDENITDEDFAVLKNFLVDKMEIQFANKSIFEK